MRTVQKKIYINFCSVFLIVEKHIPHLFHKYTFKRVLVSLPLSFFENPFFFFAIPFRKRIMYSPGSSQEKWSRWAKVYTPSPPPPPFFAIYYFPQTLSLLFWSVSACVPEAFALSTSLFIQYPGVPEIPVKALCQGHVNIGPPLEHHIPKIAYYFFFCVVPLLFEKN